MSLLHFFSLICSHSVKCSFINPIFRLDGWVQSAVLPCLLVRGVHGQKSPSVHQPNRHPLKSSTGSAPHTHTRMHIHTHRCSLQRREDEEAREDPKGERLLAAQSKHGQRGAAAQGGSFILKPGCLPRSPSEHTPFIPPGNTNAHAHKRRLRTSHFAPLSWSPAPRLRRIHALRARIRQQLLNPHGHAHRRLPPSFFSSVA